MTDLICPACGEKLDLDEMAWVWQEKFYCCEKCVRHASRQGV